MQYTGNELRHFYASDIMVSVEMSKLHCKIPNLELGIKKAEDKLVEK